MTESVKNHPLYNEPISKLILKFSLPCVISLVVNSLYNIVDQIFIGQDQGYLGNAATNVAFPLVVITFAFAVLIGDGAAAFLSLKLGHGDRESAEKGVGNSLILLAVSGILFFIIGMIFKSPLMDLFGATAENKPFAMDYIGIIIFGFPFITVATGLNSVIRADGRPMFAMISMLIGAITNTILDPIFIFVLHMGVKGAALATIIGQILSFIFSIACIRSFKSIKITKNTLKLNSQIIFKVLSLGISSFITQMAITIVMIVMNNSLKHYGALSEYGSNIPLSVLGIVMKVNQILISVTVGIAVGAQPIIGFNYGAGNYRRVKKTLLSSVGIATVFTTLGFIMFMFFPQIIINLFGQENALYNEFAKKCFRIFLMFCILNGVQTISGIFFQAVGKPMRSAIISLSRQILFFIPSLVIFPMLFGLEGCLYAGPVADGLAFILAVTLLILEIKHLDKKHNDMLIKNAADNSIV